MHFDVFYDDEDDDSQVSKRCCMIVCTPNNINWMYTSEHLGMHYALCELNDFKQIYLDIFRSSVWKLYF